MSGEDDSAHAGSKIGRTLELARKERGLSLKQVEDATKIRAAYLAEFERENFGVLPAVYVQGSLRTYANFLQLDGEEMVRELKRRRVPREELLYPLHVGPREDDSLDDIPVAVSGGAGAERRDGAEGGEVARAASLPSGITSYLYLGSAVLLVLAVAAAALGLALARDDRPAVSQVREPLVSRAPETSPPDSAEIRQPEPQKERRADNEGNRNEEADRRAQTGQAQDDSDPAQVSSGATASASAATGGSASAATEERARSDLVSARAATPTRRGGTAAPASPLAERPAGPPAERPAGPPAERPAGPPAERPAGPPPTGGSPARDGGGSGIQVRVGGEDLVRLSGGPFDD
jgi:transcriptional regulator with XRE-family HTH domain